MKQVRVPFLMYHVIHRPGDVADPQKEDPVYRVSLEEFDRQMAYLRRGGFQAITLSEFVAWHRHGDPLPEKPVLLTFDDGHPSHLELVLPRLTQYGFRAVFAVVAGWVGTPRSMLAEGLRTLQSAGMEVVSHGMDHTPLVDLSPVELRKELQNSRAQLQKILGRPVEYLAIPRGYVSVKVRQAAYEAGYQAVCTSRPGTNGPDADLYNLARLPIMAHHEIDDFIAILEGHAARRLWEMSGYLVRQGVKRVLGVKRYDQIRRALLDPSMGSFAPNA